MLALLLIVAGEAAQARAQVVLYDDFNRESFDAYHHGWAVQSYAKAKGTFGRIPDMVDNKVRMAVLVDSEGVVQQTSIASLDKFFPPTADTPNRVLEFSVSVKLDPLTAATPGLVFGISAYGRDDNGEDAVNFELVTKQINADSNGIDYDNVLLTSFHNYQFGVNDNRAFGYYPTGANAADGYHVYTMRVYHDRAQYLVDDQLVWDYDPATHLPDNKLTFVLNAWAPSPDWFTAEAPLPNNSYLFMDVDWAKVTYYTLPEPSTLPLLSVALLALWGRRGTRQRTSRC